MGRPKNTNGEPVPILRVIQVRQVRGVQSLVEILGGPNRKLIETEHQPAVGDHQKELNNAADQIHDCAGY